VKQLVQSVRTGELRLRDVPQPLPNAGQVLVAATRTVLSPGTERAVRRLASANVLQKARARPDLVRQVISKARVDGVRPTLNAVRARLDEDMPLGYSGAGVVVSVGEDASGVRPGDRVATGSAGHAEYQLVPALLAMPIPEGVCDTDAAFATVASIALQGLRQARLEIGSRVAVVGLGLLGQLSVRLAQAAGCDVVGIDVRGWTAELATASGAKGLIERGAETTDAVLNWSGGHGADAVLLTAATPSSDPVRRAPAIARDRAAIVVVGDVGLNVDRTPFYEKELDLRFSRSYGPGRYDRSYEEWAIDYPRGHIPFPEGRNLETFLNLVATGQVVVEDLVTHSFPIDRAPEAYKLLETDEHSLGVQLTYDAAPVARREVIAISERHKGGLGVGLLGAGTFARATLVPAMQAAGWDRLVTVASASGLSAAHLAERAKFERAAASVEAVVEDPDVDIVVIATPHDSHAALAHAALLAGKHVLSEKPLALTVDELRLLRDTWLSERGHLFVGFNRRYSLPVDLVRRHLADGSGPLVISYRVNAGRVGPAHWYNDRAQGGRLMGEVCHFIDTCSAIVGEGIQTVYTTSSGAGEALLDQDVAVQLRYTDGSIASITYASGGHGSTAKERVEILGRGHSVLIDDFRRTQLDGAWSKAPGQDKGHEAELRVFAKAIAGEQDGRALTATALESTGATLAAAQSLLTGLPVAPGELLTLPSL
jgi:hypothetical protein